MPGRDGVWEFPLTRQEKMQRLLILFEDEMHRSQRDSAALRRENEHLWVEVKALRGQLADLHATTQECPRNEKTDAIFEDVRSFMGQATKKVADDTSEALALIDQAKKKVADDTQQTVQMVMELTSDLENKALAAEDEALQAFDAVLQGSAKAIGEVYTNCDEALTAALGEPANRLGELAQAQAQFMHEQAQELLGQSGWQQVAKPSNSSSRMQAQADEFTGKALEAAESFRSSFWAWGQELLASPGSDGDHQAEDKPRSRTEKARSSESKDPRNPYALAPLPMPH